MARFRLRKMTVILDEIHHDGGPDAARPRQRGAVLAVVSNPFAGRYEADLQPAMEDLKPLGKAMAEKLIAALGGAEERGLVGRSEECAAALSGGLSQCYRLPSATSAPDWAEAEAAAHGAQPAPDTDGAGRRVRRLPTWEAVRDLLHHAGAHHRHAV